MRRDLGDLSTEGHLGDLADLDRRPTLDVVRALNDEDHRVAPAVGAAAEAIAAAVDAIVERLRGGGRVIYAGAGAAGGAAVLDASEWGPTFDTGDQVVALLAGAATGDVEAAEDDARGGPRGRARGGRRRRATWWSRSPPAAARRTRSAPSRPRPRWAPAPSASCATRARRSPRRSTTRSSWSSAPR